MNILEARRRTLGADVYKKTVQGNPVSARSLARMRPGLKVFGRSAQDTTTGAQLIPFELGAEMTSINGVTKCIPKKDGFRIELNGTSDQTAKSDIRFVGGYNHLEEDSYDEYENLPAGTYYAKISDNRFILNVIAWRGTNITLISTSTGGSFEVQDGDKFRIFIHPSPSAVDATVKAIISKQNDSVMYEPYTGGKPSPSTDYPQEITSAGDDGSIQVDVLGKNIFDPNYFADHYEVQGVVWYLGYKVPVGSKWTCSTSKPEKEGPIRDVFFSGRVQFTSVASGVSDQISRTVVADSGMIYLGIRSGSLTSIVNGNYWVQIEPSESATDYSPYTSQSLTVQTPNGLPGIPVDFGGNYTDADGQQWICDEIDFKRGKYVKRVVRCTGPYGIHLRESTGKYFVIVTSLISAPEPKYRGFCNISNIYSPSWRGSSYAYWFLQKNSQQIVIHLGEKYNSEEAVRQFIDENEIIVYYATETPIETVLTPEQMAAYANLHTNRPTTVVSATDGAGLELTYKTKKSLEVN